MDHLRFLCAALCLLTIFKLCLGVNTLSPGQTLAEGEVLIFPGQIFELGFFSPAKSTSKFLGVWYKAAPDVIVWVANRQNPIIGSHGVLTLAKNGALILGSAQSTIIWPSSSSRAASSPALQHLDTGNVVLVDDSTNIWQSFDHPGDDTRLQGMKMVQDPDTGESKCLTSWESADDPSVGDFSYRIENSGLSQMTIMKGTKKTYRTGYWNGRYFN